MSAAVRPPSSKRPPSPQGHFLTGQLPELRLDRLGALTRYARDYGDIVSLRLGTRRAILLSHPEYVDYVLVSANRQFIKHAPYAGAGCCSGMVC